LASELNSITYPSNRVVQQNYDAIGRLCAIAATAASCTSYTTPYATGFGYNTAFETTGFNYGNGVAAAFGYSADRLQLTSLSYVKGTTTLFSLTYGYAQNGGNDGQITSITDGVDNGRSAAYTYDPLSRLSTAVTTGSTAYPRWGLSFTYDRYGNRTTQNVTAGTAPAPQTPTDPATNRLNSSGYTYDSNGNLIVEPFAPSNNNYAYDGENRMVSFASGSASGTYTYDGKGLRVKKISGSTTTVYVFSGTKVIAEYANGSLSKEYIYAGSGLLATIANGVTTYHHAGPLSVRLSTNSSGTKVGDQGHFPFGESWYLTNTTTKWQFTSYERDAESGNDYAMARYHMSRVGRFSSPDLLAGSLGNPQSLNRYAYVGNDPVNATDPLGLLEEPSCRILENSGCGGFAGSGVYVDGVELPGFSSLGGDLVGSGAGIDETTVVTTTTIQIATIWLQQGDGPATGDGSVFSTGTSDSLYTQTNPIYTEVSYLPSFSIGGGYYGRDGGGSAANNVSKAYELTTPCNSSASQLMQTVESSFSKFGNYSAWGGHVTFSPPAGMGVGSTIPINVGIFGISQNLSVNVDSMTAGHMTFTTNPGHLLYPAYITFAAGPASPGSINFYISLGGTVASPMEFNFGGSAFEDAQWNHFLGQVTAFCKAGQ
jgi:RHS repeat-associated protein